MNKLQRVLATISHEEPDVIPNQEIFFDTTSQEKFLSFSESRLTCGDPDTIDEFLQKQIKYAELMDTYIVGVDSGGLCSRVIQREKNYHILEFENGAKWRIRERPFNREYIDLPIKRKEDLDKMPMPDPKDSKRYEGVEERVKYLTRKGYFTFAEIDGFFPRCLV